MGNVSFVKDSTTLQLCGSFIFGSNKNQFPECCLFLVFSFSSGIYRTGSPASVPILECQSDGLLFSRTGAASQNWHQIGERVWRNGPSRSAHLVCAHTLVKGPQFIHLVPI